MYARAADYEERPTNDARVESSHACGTYFVIFRIEDWPANSLITRSLPTAVSIAAAVGTRYARHR